MRVLTFGWDFPPVKNGGLGVACHGLTQELLNMGIEVIFVLPRQQKVEGPMRFIFANIKASEVHVIDSPLRPYHSSNSCVEHFDPDGKRVRLSRSILEEVHRYAEASVNIAQRESFDIIHAHDWTSYLAGLAAKKVSGKPLVLHVHATAYDQAASDNVDPEVYNIEFQAFHTADRIITVSEFTKRMLINKYDVPEGKIEAIHNGIKPTEIKRYPEVLKGLKMQGKKIVLYHGRITIQKGVDHFIRAARRVVDVDKDVVFVISGWGDMEQQIMHLTASLGLSKHVIFPGALWDEERDQMYQSADLLVMPSVSEPFGLVPLESIQHGTPVLISKQSGVSEVLTHALKVDFWDIDDMANKMLATLRYSSMSRQLVNNGKNEIMQLTWHEAAKKVISVYRKLMGFISKKDIK